MALATQIVIITIALLHICFLILEMFLWDKPLGMRVFGQALAEAKSSKVLAANQGLYNGFLAAGLIWGLLSGYEGFSIEIFFLSCILIAGTFGGLTANRKILVVQALPAVLGLILLLS